MMSVKEIAKSIVGGQLLIKLDIGKYFLHILWLFFLFVLIIWFDLVVDSTLANVEKNKAEIVKLQSVCAQKQFEVEELMNRGATDDALEAMGSEVRKNTKPATILDKKEE